MAQNTFLETGFSDEDATVYALEADVAAKIAGFIHARFPNNQRGAGRQLGIHQSEVSALMAGNIGRFSLSKLIKLARRAGLRLYLDMGDDARQAAVVSLRPNIVPIRSFRANANFGAVEIVDARMVNSAQKVEVINSNSTVGP